MFACGVNDKAQDKTTEASTTLGSTKAEDYQIMIKADKDSSGNIIEDSVSIRAVPANSIISDNNKDEIFAAGKEISVQAGDQDDLGTSSESCYGRCCGKRAASSYCGYNGRGNHYSVIQSVPRSSAAYTSWFPGKWALYGTGRLLQGIGTILSGDFRRARLAYSYGGAYSSSFYPQGVYTSSCGAVMNSYYATSCATSSYYYFNQQYSSYSSYGYNGYDSGYNNGGYYYGGY
jgi:hypothetical protein